MANPPDPAYRPYPASDTPYDRSRLAPRLLLGFTVIGGVFPALEAQGAGPGELRDGGDLSHDRFIPSEGSAQLPLIDPDVARGADDVIFVNFDGAQLTKSYQNDDDARSNVSMICGGAYPPWGDNPTLQATVMQAFRNDWKAYDVNIVTSRPASGRYTMLMAGPGGPLCGQPAGGGIAPVDCNNFEPDSVVFAFTSAQWGNSANGEATVYSQEVAHSYGLEHVADPDDIMNATYDNSKNQRFKDQCTPTTGNIYCGQQHAAQCGSQTMQNAHLELLAILGAAIPDTTPPTVVIEFPQDGQVFAPGEDFDVQGTATDDREVKSVSLWVNGMDTGAVDAEAPYSWPITNIPEGTYDLELVAIDRSGNEASSPTVTIEVTAAGGGGSGGGDSGGGTFGGDGGSGGTDSGGSGDGGLETGTGPWIPPGESGGALPPGYGERREGVEGCACASAGHRGTAGWVIVPLLVLARRRRA